MERPLDDIFRGSDCSITRVQKIGPIFDRQEELEGIWFVRDRTVKLSTASPNNAVPLDKLQPILSGAIFPVRYLGE
jgi:hypothetical protein